MSLPITSPSVSAEVNDEVTHDIWRLVVSGTPTSGGSGTGNGLAGPGSTCTDIATGNIYINTNTKASPTWTKIVGSGKDIGAATGTSLLASGLIKSSSPSTGIGYATGAGSTVTQGTSRTTAVTINAICGAITLVSAAGSATPASFTVNNTSVGATDVVIVKQKSGTDLYEIFVTNIAANSFQITSFTTGGTTTESPVFNFVVIKAVTS